MKRSRLAWGILCFGITLFLINTGPTANASGFRIPEMSIAGLGTSDALVANPDELGALTYNPAAMSFHQGSNLSVGLILINPSISVTPEGGSGEVDSDARSVIPVPNLYYMSQVTSNWSLGLNISTPFGLETKWPDETFPRFALLDPSDPSTDVDAFEPALTKIEMININPNLAYKISAANTSIAVGADFYMVRNTVLDTQAIGINGDGSGFGWNVALMHATGPLSLGLSYRSGVEVDIDGTFDATRVTSTSTSASTKVNFPDIWQIGARYEVLPALAIEFDVEYTGWSSIDVITISHSNPAPIPNPFVETHDWSNTTTYRLGTTYHLNPKTQLRFGYAFDNTPQEDEHFSARIPDADRHSFSVGLKHDMGKWALEAGYMYVRLEDRTIKSTIPFREGDPNGTDAFNGRYESHGNLFGLGFNVKF